MSRTKPVADPRSAPGNNVPMPRTDPEAEQLIAAIGATQRDLADRKAKHDGTVALLEERWAGERKALESAIAVMTEAVEAWASANRARLTEGGRKTVQLATGTISWREGSYEVRLARGVKAAQVIAAIAARVAVLTEELSRAISRRKQPDITRLTEEIGLLRGFTRTKVELAKNALLAARATAETLPGVTVARADESFSVEPLASQIREVA